MAVTRSSAAERMTVRNASASRNGSRLKELAWTLAASLLIASGLFRVYVAKTQGLSEVDSALISKKLLNLNELNTRDDLLPFLDFIASGSDRQQIAHKIYDQSGSLSNAGRIRPVLTAEQFRLLKPRVVVRRPSQFRRAFFLWAGLFLAAFLLVHIWWTVTGFGGDQTLLPAALLLTGTGLISMVSLRDPVRDNVLFVDFAQGVVGGCLLLALLSSLNYEKLFGKLSYVPLLASLALSTLLILFGTGPGSSDAKVNLIGVQPVEAIRLLLILFLAGYFAQRWDMLRHARDRRPKLAAIARRIDLPPAEYVLPVAVCVALSLIFFFLQKDLGPALVFACLFLTLYGMARNGLLVPATGLALLAAGFGAGTLLGVPHTVGERVSMWLSPWDNLVHGGDQLAHSLWAFATGGPSGMGIGQGDPQLVPAVHTDLILAVVGEQWGFVGVVAVFALFAFIVYRTFRIALGARTDYEFFLGTGLAAATALQVLLIAGGALGLVPLSGVVTPFLSYGRSAMLANFLLIAIVLSISAHAAQEPVQASAGTRPFHAPAETVGIIFAIGASLVLVKAAYVQVFHDSAMMGAGTLVMQADGVRRYEYNPRFQEIIREIPKGTIFDSNGLPVATSNWNELEKHRAEYEQLGIDIDRACPRADTRYYPFGGLMFDLLGDLRTRTRWGASNTSFLERDSARRLRGYDDRPMLVDVKNPQTGAVEHTIRYDYRELVPLLRHRHEPGNPEVRKVLDRPRDVRMSIDVRLQVKVAEILHGQLQKAGKVNGAAVVIDVATGDLLASVSYPLPSQEPSSGTPETNPYLDRARYGLYPPGSTFKVVTAMAALRKDAGLTHKRYECIRLPDGRVGNNVHGSRRPVRDDVQDRSPHGSVDMEHGMIVSCNAFFAQLGAYDVGAKPLFDTANLLGILAAAPNTAAQLRKSLPQSSYGQGQVLATPFQMARVAATVANNGSFLEGRWITDETNTRTAAPVSVLGPEAAQTLARFMREAVTSGTGMRALEAAAPIAGKTGTAELAQAPSHAWFIGYAPYGATSRKIAFSVLVENGVYGGTTAAPAAAEIVNASVKLGLIRP